MKKLSSAGRAREDKAPGKLGQVSLALISLLAGRRTALLLRR